MFTVKLARGTVSFPRETIREVATVAQFWGVPLRVAIRKVASDKAPILVAS